MRVIHVALFALLTWGPILGLPIATLFILSPRTPTWLALTAAAGVLGLGVFFGEWLARGVNRLLKPLQGK